MSTRSRICSAITCWAEEGGRARRAARLCAGGPCSSGCERRNSPGCVRLAAIGGAVVAGRSGWLRSDDGRRASSPGSPVTGSSAYLASFVTLGTNLFLTVSSCRKANGDRHSLFLILRRSGEPQATASNSWPLPSPARAIRLATSGRNIGDDISRRECSPVRAHHLLRHGLWSTPIRRTNGVVSGQFDNETVERIIQAIIHLLEFGPCLAPSRSYRHKLTPSRREAKGEGYAECLSDLEVFIANARKVATGRRLRNQIRTQQPTNGHDKSSTAHAKKRRAKKRTLVGRAAKIAR